MPPKWVHTADTAALDVPFEWVSAGTVGRSVWFRATAVVHPDTSFAATSAFALRASRAPARRSRRRVLQSAAYEGGGSSVIVATSACAAATPLVKPHFA